MALHYLQPLNASSKASSNDGGKLLSRRISILQWVCLRKKEDQEGRNDSYNTDHKKHRHLVKYLHVLCQGSLQVTLEGRVTLFLLPYYLSPLSYKTICFFWLLSFLFKMYFLQFCFFHSYSVFKFCSMGRHKILLMFFFWFGLFCFGMVCMYIVNVCFLFKYFFFHFVETIWLFRVWFCFGWLFGLDFHVFFFFCETDKLILLQFNYYLIIHCYHKWFIKYIWKINN